MEALKYKSQICAGQSLIELLIAIGVGVIIILAGVSAVSVYLRVSSQDATYQGATFLAQELIDNATVMAEGDWQKLVNADPALNHYLIAGAAGFAVADGKETKLMGDLTYKRYFTISSVFRSGDDIVESGGENDLSTKKIKVTVEWLYRGQLASLFLEKYVTRSTNFVLWQTDWVGGATCSGSCTGACDISIVGYNTRFCISGADVDFSSTPGSVKIFGL